MAVARGHHTEHADECAGAVGRDGDTHHHGQIGAKQCLQGLCAAVGIVAKHGDMDGVVAHPTGQDAGGERKLVPV
jgi:hypothetical protein